MNTFLNTIKNYIQQGIHFSYKTLIEPKTISEDDRRKEFILNYILLGTIILLAWSNLFICIDIFYRGALHKGVSLFIFLLFTLLFVGIYVGSRQRFMKQASYLVVGLYYAGASYAEYIWGPDLPASLLAYALIIVIVGILINTRIAVTTGIVIALTITVLGYLESTKTILPDLHWKNDVFVMGDALEYALILLVIMLVSWLSNRDLEKSLARASNSEEELRKERNLLEVRVEERTKELKQVQLDKLTQMYRFVEFGRLSSGIFHDLMNPLNAVSLNIEKLKSIESSETPAISIYLEKALSASKKMESFVSAVKKKIQSQEVSSYFSLNNEIEEVVSILEHKASISQVEIIFTAPEELFTEGNPLKFHQIITNLISNAIDSYEKKIDRKASEQVCVDLSQNNNLASITITDFGTGIPEEYIEQIFDPFYTTKSIQKGTGLGLSTTKHIVEKYFKGTVEVKSTLNKGTTFVVNIPLNSNII